MGGKQCNDAAGLLLCTRHNLCNSRIPQMVLLHSEGLWHCRIAVTLRALVCSLYTKPSRQVTVVPSICSLMPHTNLGPIIHVWSMARVGGHNGQVHPGTPFPGTRGLCTVLESSLSDLSTWKIRLPRFNKSVTVARKLWASKKWLSAFCKFEQLEQITFFHSYF